jgi:hypothetical protein
VPSHLYGVIAWVGIVDTWKGDCLVSSSREKISWCANSSLGHISIFIKFLRSFEKIRTQKVASRIIHMRVHMTQLAVPLAMATGSVIYSNSFPSRVVSMIDFLAHSMSTLCFLNQSISRMTSMAFKYKTMRLATMSTPPPPYFKILLRV